MSDDLFDFDSDDLDWDNVKDDPFYKEDGTYLCKVIEAVKRGSKNGGRGLSLTYTILEGEHEKKRIQEWKTIPHKWELKGYESKEDMENEINFNRDIQVAADRNLSFLKIRLAEFGFTPAEMNDVKPQQMLDLSPMEITIYHDRTGREKIKSVAFPEDETDSEEPFPTTNY